MFVLDEDEEKVEERDGWETVNMDGQTFGIRTAAIEEKCQAFETMVIFASTLNARYAPYLAQSLEITLPALRFYFHDGVREACALYVSKLMSPPIINCLLQVITDAPSLRPTVRNTHGSDDCRYFAAAHQCHFR